MTTYDFSYEGFAQWLRDHNPEDTAGYTCTDQKCPGHEFWKDYLESIGEEYEDDLFTRVRIDTPWLETFARILDTRYGEPTGPKSMIKPVTYAQALAVLESISTPVHDSQTHIIDTHPTTVL